MALRLAICCGNSLFAEGLRSLLAKESGIEIVGTFHGENFLEDLNKADEMRPDVLLLDATVDLKALITLPDDYFLFDRLKILLIGDSGVKYIINKSLRNLMIKGIVGVLPPSADSDLLKKALKAIALGELWLDRATLLKLVACMKQSAPNVRLAHREREIISHICQGFKNKEIAQKLHISEQTVKSHCNRIYKKLGVTDRLQLALHSHKVFSDTHRDNR
jgi:DNA-binding NarL/FixJ family response regulator